VKHVARAQRVDRVHREHRALAHCRAFAPEHVVRAMGDGEKRRGRCGNRGEPGSEIVAPGGGAQTLAGEHHVGGDAKQLVADLRRPVGVEHDHEAAGARRLADRLHELGETVIGKDRVGGCDELSRVDGPRRAEALIAMGDDHALAMRVEEDRGNRRGRAGEALAAAAIDLFARKRRQHALAVRIISERPGQRRAAAKPRHGDGGIGGAAAVDDEEALRLDFFVGPREVVGLEYLVEHDDARAQDRARVGAGASWIQLLPLQGFAVQ
jgi:hypothetical protein